MPGRRGEPQRAKTKDTPVISPPSSAGKSKVSTGRAWVEAIQVTSRSASTTPVASPVLESAPHSPEPAANDAPEEAPPLQKKWCVWFNSAPAPTRGGRGGARAEPPPPKLLGSFDNVVDMWRWLNNTRQPSQFQTDANIHFFEDGSEPFWEHKANANGGRWLTTICEHQTADEKWTNLCLAVFGNATPDIEEEVVGLIASHRRNYVRLSVWTRNKTSPVTREVGEYLKKEADIGDFEYQAHGADYAKLLHVLKST